MERIQELAWRCFVIANLLLAHPSPISSQEHENTQNGHIEVLNQEEADVWEVIDGIRDDYNIGIKSFGYMPTLEMVQTVRGALDLVPNPGYLVQRIVFFPINSQRAGAYHSLPSISEGIISLHHNPEMDMSEAVPQNYRILGRIEIPNRGYFLEEVTLHELGHGFADIVLYLNSPDLQTYNWRKLHQWMDRDNPVHRALAEVAGFDFIELPEDCQPVTDLELLDCEISEPYSTIVINGKEYSRRNFGWVRRIEYLSQMQISNYEQTEDKVFEVSAEYFRAGVPQRRLSADRQILSPHAQIFTNNIREGLASDDPASFLQAVADDPEGMLLRGIDLKAFNIR